MLFFLEHAGELRIIILKEEDIVLQRLREPTQTHSNPPTRAQGLNHRKLPTGRPSFYHTKTPAESMESPLAPAELQQ